MQDKLSRQLDSRHRHISVKVFTLTSTLAASVDGLLDETRIARDLATPPEPTLTIDLLLDDSGVVASTAAEQLTAFDPRTSRITLTTCRP